MVARMIDLKLRKALGEAAKLFKPPPATTLIEWADRFRVVASGTQRDPRQMANLGTALRFWPDGGGGRGRYAYDHRHG
jgi:hypothetical protein